MDFLQDKINDAYEYYLHTLTFSDPRVADWFLMQSPLPTIGIAILYLTFVWLGPKFMANREPFRFQYFMIFYNFSCVLLGCHIVKECLYCAYYKRQYNLFCQEVVYTDDEYELRVAKALWWFYFSKWYEMLDTVIFILRKKNQQVSFLHVYHHTSMFLLWWIGIKWVAGGLSVFGAMVNSFVHIIMYSYYGLSALGPMFYKYLWWKKYLTLLQFVQFVIGLAFAIQSIYFQCKFPLWMQWAFLFYGTSLIILFSNFYIHAYIKKERLPKSEVNTKNKQQNGVKSKKTKNGKISNGVSNGKKYK